MLGKLLPRAKVDFFALFSRHAALTREAAARCGSCSTTSASAEGYSNRIRALEHDADAICQEAMERLHRTFVTPIERTDLHALASRLDDITDHVESAAQRLWLYEIHTATPEVREMVEHLCRATEAVRETVDALSGRRDGDRIRRSAGPEAGREGERPAAAAGHREALPRRGGREDVIKWKEIYESLEDAIDGCEDVANVIEGVVLENA